MMFLNYLTAVFKRVKYLLGGGSLLLITAGIVERFVAQSISWAIYTWLLVACLVGALLGDGFSQFKRLQRKLSICGLERSVWPYERFAKTGVGYHFLVRNLSGGDSLDEVHAEITSIAPPLQYLPLPVALKVKHREWHVRTFRLDPLCEEQFDLITGPTSHPRSQKATIITYISEPREAFEELPNRKHTITVRVAAKDCAPVTAIFETWIDETGELRCIQL